MKSVKAIAVLTLFALLLPVSVFAKDTNKGKMNLSSSAEVAGTQLQPGDYTVEWSGTGPAAQVQFIRNGKTVATTQGNIVELNKRSPYDQVVLSTEGGQNTIKEIDFGNKTTAVRFGETSQTAGQ